MTNTYMLPARIRRGDRGLRREGSYCRHSAASGGHSRPGSSWFSASEAYLIENGRITRPVKGATLIGNGPDVMTRISMVGDDLRLDDGVGTCGKDGQDIPVGVGQPTLRVDGLTVGGTG